MAFKKTDDNVLSIPPLRQETIRLRIIGVRPMYQNRMTEKYRQEMLVGVGKKTAAQKLEIRQKPFDEFRSSAEIISEGPTALGVLVVAVKGAMVSAATISGIKMTDTRKMIFMPGDHFALYGTPRLKLDVVRQAGITGAPQMRTRAYLPRWGAEVEISYIHPNLNATGVATLLANAGKMIGIGDFRQEKGKGSFGAFRVVGPDEQDDEWDDLVENHGRFAQEEALRDPEFADDRTRELMDFYQQEVLRRSA